MFLRLSLRGHSQVFEVNVHLVGHDGIMRTSVGGEGVGHHIELIGDCDATKIEDNGSSGVRVLGHVDHRGFNGYR